MSDLGQLAGNVLLILGSIAVVVLGSALVYRIRKDLFDDDQPTRDELLAPYREAYEEGEIAREEYERICQAVQEGGTSLQEELLHGLSRGRIKAELETAREEEARSMVEIDEDGESARPV